MTSALVPNLSCALEHDAYVGVTAEGAFFHVDVGDAGVEEDLFEARKVLVGLVGGADVGFGDDLDERSSAAVEVDVGARDRVGEAVVEALAGVLFQVEAGDADALGVACCVGDVDLAVLGERLVELRDLVALGRGRGRSSFCGRRCWSRGPRS